MRYTRISMLLIGMFFCLSIAKADDVFCTAQYDPVCGVNGVTYGNDCTATQQSKVAIAYKGECLPPDLQYCTAYFDGCNSCGVSDGQLTQCTQKACFQHQTPRCTSFVDTVKVNDIIVLDTTKKEEINSIFTTVTSIRNSLSITIQKKYYTLLGTVIELKVKERKDFAKVAKFTADGYIQFQRKIAIYLYLHFLVEQKIAGL